MVAQDPDPGRELVGPRQDWWHGLARMIGFELAASVTIVSADSDYTSTVRRQHLQNGAILRRLMWPSMN